MNKTLVSVIDEIIKLAPIEPLEGLQKAISGPSWLKLDVGNDFLNQIKSIPEYQNFDQCLQSLGTRACSTKMMELADWLIERARLVGSHQAIEEIDTYCDSEKVQVHEVILLAGVNIDSEFRFCNDVELIHSHSIPNRYIARNIVNNYFNSVLPFPKVHSVLIASYDQEISHISNTDMMAKAPVPNIPIDKLKETRLCLVLARPVGYGVHSIGHGSVAPDNLPFIQSSSGWSIHPFKQPPLSPPILEIEMKTANHLLEKYQKLSDTVKSKLAISIERFNGYCSGETLENQAIDLRICLESIFLDDDNKEQLSYRLSLRSALFLGQNLDEKQEIMRTIKKAYNFTSTVVHTGKPPKNNKNYDSLLESAKLAKRAILKIIDGGSVCWHKLELQADSTNI